MAKRTRKMLKESQLFLTMLGWRTRKVRERNGRTAKKRKAKAMISTITMSREQERECERRGREEVGYGRLGPLGLLRLCEKNEGMRSVY
jgi:hypothetical protein